MKERGPSLAKGRARGRARLFGAGLLACVGALALGWPIREAWGQVGGAPSAMDPPGPPGRYLLEGVELRGNRRTSASVLERYLPFRRGDLLDVDAPDLQAARYRLLGTGFFSSVQLSLKRGRVRGSAVLVVEVVERNTLVVQNLAMGIAADAPGDRRSRPISPYLGLAAAETNLLGSGMSLGAALGLAQQQLAVRATLAAVPLGQSAWTSSLTGLYTDARDYFGASGVLSDTDPALAQGVEEYAVVPYKRRGGELGFERPLGLSDRLRLGYRLERLDATVPSVASQLSQGTREPITFGIFAGESLLSGLKASWLEDSRDRPLLPHRGNLLALDLSLGSPVLGSSYAFQKLVVTEAHWFPLWRGQTLRLDATTGLIAGEAPFFERFYVGDLSDFVPDRVVELSPDRRRAPNFLDTSVVEARYGDLAAKLAAEYRWPLYRGRGSVYGADAFLGAGLWGVGSRRGLQRASTRYEGWHRLPVDLTANLGVKVDTRAGGFTLALSNFVAILPGMGGPE